MRKIERIMTVDGNTVETLINRAYLFRENFDTENDWSHVVENLTGNWDSNIVSICVTVITNCIDKVEHEEELAIYRAKDARKE